MNFFQNYFFQNILSGMISVIQKVWIRIKCNVLFGLNCVQSVCKGHQQTTIADNELLETVLAFFIIKCFSSIALIL